MSRRRSATQLPVKPTTPNTTPNTGQPRWELGDAATCYISEKTRITR
ncbi:MAG: hypothetical protein ACYTX0_53500 [Nostoc sp.]